MQYQLTDIIRPSEIGVDKCAYLGAPIILEQGLESALITDSEKSQIHTVDLIKKKHLGHIDLSDKHSLCIRGVACHEGYLFATSDGSKGYVIDDENSLVGHFRGNIWRYGPVRDIAVIGREMWGATNFLPALVKLQPWEGQPDSYKSDTLGFSHRFDGVKIVRDITEDVSDYPKVGHQSFIYKICGIDSYVALLLSNIDQEGKVFFYDKEGRKEDEMTVEKHNSWMVYHEGLLYISKARGIMLYDPKTKKKVDEITDSRMHFPSNVAVQDGKLVTASHKFTPDREMEFLVFEKKQ